MDKELEKTILGIDGMSESLKAMKTELDDDFTARVARSNEPAKSTRKKSILVIDDMSENLRAIKAVLEDEFTVRLARSGELAKSILNSIIVDLILLDIEMPDTNGFEYLDWLKSNPVTRHIPVIFVSSHGESDIVRSATTMEIAGYIKKPVDPERLKQRIYHALAGK